MRLYYFTTAEHGLSALRDRKLKIALIDQLNDPFEMYFTDLTAPESRRKADGQRNAFASKYGLICGSQCWTEPLMWGHYAGKHTGICLGIEIQDDNENAFTAKYNSERLIYTKEEVDKIKKQNELSTEFNGKHDSNYRNFVNEVLSRKYIKWNYEKEFRILYDINKSIKKDNLYFAPIEEIGIIKEVIIGLRSSVTIPDAFRALTYDTNNTADIENVEIYRASMSPNKFEMIKGESSRP